MQGAKIVRALDIPDAVAKFIGYKTATVIRGKQTLFDGSRVLFETADFGSFLCKFLQHDTNGYWYEIFPIIQ